MTEQERIKNLQRALGVIRKGVSDFLAMYEKEENTPATEASAEILDMVDRVIDIYA